MKGVEITNKNYGNIKVNSATDFVLGAFNSLLNGQNWHSSGVRAIFNQGATRVGFMDTDDDSTVKAVFGPSTCRTRLYTECAGSVFYN